MRTVGDGRLRTGSVGSAMLPSHRGLGPGAHVIETGPRFLERLTLVITMPMEHDRELPCLVGEQLPRAAVVSVFRPVRNVKDLSIPERMLASRSVTVSAV